MLEVVNLNCGYKDKVILENVSFTAEKGDIVCILGPNGSGKSTLIKTIVGLIPSIKGEILVNQFKINNLSWGKRAKIMSYIPQTFSSVFQYKVIDIVLMGRTSYVGLSTEPSKKDIETAEKSIEKLNISYLSDKVYSQISGGERQLVKIAQALTQESKIIVMDEPTNSLDFGNQSTILNHLKDCSKLGITIIMATHFPEQALYYGTKALLVKNKNVIEVNKPKINLKEEQLQDLYNINMKIIEVDINGETRKICLT